MQKPLLFISHKTADAKVGEIVANFVREISGGHVDVYLSSNPSFQGPRVGKELGDELRQALLRAGVVVLVYTSQDQDWSWCMWECGLAEDPKSRDNTKIVVVQCLRDSPDVFSSMVRVQTWDLGSLIKFAKLFQEPDFFPGEDRKMTELNDGELERKATKLYRELEAAIPQEPTENWPAWPFVRLELPKTGIESLKDLDSDESLKAVRTMLKISRLLKSGGGLPQLFGKNNLKAVSSFGDLIEASERSQPNGSLGWLNVLATQILYGAHGNTPQVQRSDHFRGVGGDTTEYLPTIGLVMSNPGTFHVDCYFVGVSQVSDSRIANTNLRGKWQSTWWYKGPYLPRAEGSSEKVVLEDEEKIEDSVDLYEVTDGELRGLGENEERGDIKIKGRIHDVNFVTLNWGPKSGNSWARGGVAILRLNQTRTKMNGFWYEFNDVGEFYGGDTFWVRENKT